MRICQLKDRKQLIENATREEEGVFLSSPWRIRYKIKT